MKTNVHLFIMSRSVLLRMRNASDRSCLESRNIQFYVRQPFFKKKHCAVYKIMWKYIVEPDSSVAHAHCVPDIL
jgi:hypothetical protein